MPADLRIGPREWAAAVAAAALLHVLAIVGFEAGGALGWLRAETDRRPAASQGVLRLALSASSSVPSPSSALSPSSAAATALPSSGSGTAPGTAPSSSRSLPSVDSPSSSAASATSATREGADPESGAVTTAAPAADALHESDTPRASSPAGPGAAGAGAAEPSPTRDSGASAPLAAVGAAGGGGSQSFAYFTALYERILGVHDYPRRALREQIEGTVLVSIRIDRRGRIASTRVRESSGSPLLDRHALRTVERAAPFGAVPADTDDRELDFDLPLEYRLR